jgi:hypothetical protein
MEYAEVIAAFGMMYQMPLAAGHEGKQIEFAIVLYLFLY